MLCTWHVGVCSWCQYYHTVPVAILHSSLSEAGVRGLVQKAPHGVCLCMLASTTLVLQPRTLEGVKDPWRLGLSLGSGV